MQRAGGKRSPEKPHRHAPHLVPSPRRPGCCPPRGLPSQKGHLSSLEGEQEAPGRAKALGCQRDPQASLCLRSQQKGTGEDPVKKEGQWGFLGDKEVFLTNACGTRATAG